MHFVAPTIEYLQRDFKSGEGFFCDNRDTHLLHANDDDRYYLRFRIFTVIFED